MNSVCPECGAQIADQLKSCPQCHYLVHSERLKELRDLAQRAEQDGDPRSALAAWREGLDLLPAGSKQGRLVAAQVQRLSAEVDQLTPGAKPAKAEHRSDASAEGKSKLAVAGLGIVGLLAFVLTKGKALLLGLTKAGTVFSMLLSLGLYWSLWGWRFALGLIASIYVHEMGHVMALRHFGIKAGAPSFLPGIGAVVRMKQYPATRIEDARVGLAGPIWGLGAAVVAYGVFRITGAPIWGAIAQIGAWINLFNLLPIPPLDGGRGFRALDSVQRLLVTASIGAMWALTEQSLLILLLMVAGMQCFTPAAPKGDWRAAIHYVALVVALSLLAQFALPGDVFEHLSGDG